jgi:hypothetical protein
MENLRLLGCLLNGRLLVSSNEGKIRILEHRVSIAELPNLVLVEKSALLDGQRSSQLGMVSSFQLGSRWLGRVCLTADNLGQGATAQVNSTLSSVAGRFNGRQKSKSNAGRRGQVCYNASRSRIKC